MSSARPETTRKGTEITSVVCEKSQRLASVTQTSQATRTNHARAYQTFFLYSVVYITLNLLDL